MVCSLGRAHRCYPKIINMLVDFKELLKLLSVLLNSPGLGLKNWDQPRPYRPTGIRPLSTTLQRAIQSMLSGLPIIGEPRKACFALMFSRVGQEYETTDLQESSLHDTIAWTQMNHPASSIKTSIHFQPWRMSQFPPAGSQGGMCHPQHLCKVMWSTGEKSSWCGCCFLES